MLGLFKRGFMLFTMVLLMFHVSACSGDYIPDAGEATLAHFPTPTGEYIEFYCHSACHGHRLAKFETRIHDADLIEKYADTLNAMFDYEWTLLSTEEIYVAFDLERFISEFLCHLEHYYRYSARSVQFYEWTIEYRDGNGDVRHFVFDSRPRYGGFSSHVTRYVRDYLSEYFRERFFDVYLGDLPLVQPFSVSLFFESGTTSNDYDRWRSWKNKTDEYHKRLATPEGAIRLARLTPAIIFEQAPVRLGANIRVDEYPGTDQSAFRELVETRVEDLAATLNQFTNNQMRASIRLQFRDGAIGATEQARFYIQGERIFVNHPSDFAWYVLESYRGMFW